MIRRIVFTSVAAIALCASSLAFGASSVSNIRSTLTATPTAFSGNCPATITLNGNIMVVGQIDPRAPVQIGYQFLRSDGATGPIAYYTIAAPGPHAVHTTWTLGGSALPAYAGWEQLKAWPTRHEGGFGYAVSDKATFKISCAGKIWKSGHVDLRQTYALDLDSGQVKQPGSDVWFHAVDWDHMFLAPQNGAQMSAAEYAGAGHPMRDLAGCSQAAFSTTPRPVMALTTGASYCVKTSEGRIAQFKINQMIGNARAKVPLTLSIGFTTWAN